jgi:hypothetical protein
METTVKSWLKEQKTDLLWAGAKETHPMVWQVTVSCFLTALRIFIFQELETCLPEKKRKLSQTLSKALYLAYRT